MGTYSELCIGGYPVWSTKSSVTAEVMTIFREADKHVKSRMLSERNPLVWGESDRDLVEATETAVFYSCKASVAAQRLDVMGFSLQRVRCEFEHGRHTEIEKFSSWEEEGNSGGWFSEELDSLKTLSFEEYCEGLKQVLTKKLLPYPFEDCEREDISPIEKYILQENEYFCLGFLGPNLRSLLRLICSLVSDDALVEQDITNLVSAGYYTVDEDVCENAIRSLITSYPENSSRIILTEGSTDREFLGNAIDILYPHLSEYYSFLDFDGARARGGAGHLVSMVKAFAAAGVTNRIIALFDNDTAAFEARRPLNGMKLPDNIAVLNYPDLDFLRKYPTLGPGGQTELDINGLAASIELYLGVDVLIESEGLTSVQWKGYNETLSQYHGEVMHKSRIHKSFRRKIELCRKDEREFEKADWDGLRAILAEVFNAFP